MTIILYHISWIILCVYIYIYIFFQIKLITFLSLDICTGQCWECLFFISMRTARLIPEPCFPLCKWGLRTQFPNQWPAGPENTKIATSSALVSSWPFCLTLDSTSLCPVKGYKRTILAVRVCTAASKLHTSIQGWVCVSGRILRYLALVIHTLSQFFNHSSI